MELRRNLMVQRQNIFLPKTLLPWATHSMLRPTGLIACLIAILIVSQSGPSIEAQSLTQSPSAGENATGKKIDKASHSANQGSKQWFQNAKFGLFIHWGVYSVLGQGEWVMHNNKMSITEYEKIPPQFNPTDFNAAEWVSLAKGAGMKYITITSKHHDGFAMFDSKVSDYDVVDRTAYKKDVLKMLADECRKQGIKLFFYHSHLDWHHPDYFPLGITGQYSGRTPGGSWNNYLDYMDTQLKELCTNYGEIGGIWFDGWWDK